MRLFDMSTIRSLFYWIFVLTIRVKRRKTFELRFLANGLSGFSVSSLFWILYASLSLFQEATVMGFEFLLWVLLFYLIFSVLYICLIVLGVHKGIFKKIKEKSQTPKALAISAFFAAILPGAGAIGMHAHRILRAHASVAVQDIVESFAFISIIFLPALAHINFVQYFYCKKYKIFCDENGNTTSPNLEYRKKQKRDKAERSEISLEKPGISKKKRAKKNKHLWVKILIGILAIPVVFILVVFLVFSIKGFIRGFIKGVS